MKFTTTLFVAIAAALALTSQSAFADNSIEQSIVGPDAMGRKCCYYKTKTRSGAYLSKPGKKCPHHTEPHPACCCGKTTCDIKVHCPKRKSELEERSFFYEGDEDEE